MRYELSIPASVVVGPGTAAELPAHMAAIGRRAILVTSRGAQRRGGPVAELSAQLRDAGLVMAEALVDGEPRVETVERACADLAGGPYDMVVAIGGGSVIDSAKAIAALYTNGGSALDYLEVIGAGRPLERPALPIIALPTTAGAGSEATRNAVLRSERHGVKASMRHPSLMPRVALVDATLSADTPPHVTASCGMDALTQLIEPFVSRRAGPLTDGMCREGIALSARSLRRVYANPDDDQARSDMALAALLSGMALANAGLGAVHGIAAPFGGMVDAPHGALCAALLAPITAANLRALAAEPGGAVVLERYHEIARIVGAGTAFALPDWLETLRGELAIARLGSYGASRDAIGEIAARAAASSSMRSNPVALDADALAAAIAAAW